MIAALILSRNSIVCDNPAPLTDFNGEAYMGTWYEIQRVPYFPFQVEAATCTEAQYSNIDGTTGIFSIHNSQQSKSFGNRTAATGTGRCPDASGRCYVSFYGPEPATPNYQVISTDYETFAIVYGCQTNYFKPNLWYLARTTAISDTLLAQMQATA